MMVTMWIKSGALTEPLCSYTASPHVSVMRKTGVGRCFGHHQAQSLWYFLFKPQKNIQTNFIFKYLKPGGHMVKKKKKNSNYTWLKNKGKKTTFPITHH